MQETIFYIIFTILINTFLGTEVDYKQGNQTFKHGEMIKTSQIWLKY